MYTVPLSLKNKIGYVTVKDPDDIKLLVHKDVLYILMTKKEYLEMIQIPLLAQSEEKIIGKSVFPLSACMTTYKDQVVVFAVSKNTIGVYDADLKLLKSTKRSTSTCILKPFHNGAILFTKNTFFRIGLDLSIKKINISPYFATIKNFHIGYVADKPYILYRTSNSFSIYFITGECIVSNFRCDNEVFVKKGRIYFKDGTTFLVYKVNENGCEQVKSVNIPISNRFICKFFDIIGSNAVFSGSDNSECIFHYNKSTFNTNSVILDFVEYSNCLFCVNKENLYFIPSDQSYNIKLTGTEEIALKNILDKNNSTFVIRNFDVPKFDVFFNKNCLVDGSMKKCESLSKKYSANPDGSKTKADTTADIYEGEHCKYKHYFLGVLIFRGFKAQLVKLICNALNKVKKCGKGESYLRLLYDLNRFSYKIYVVFTDKTISFDRLYTDITNVLDLEDVNEDLLLECLDVEWRDDTTYEFKNVELFMYIKGVNQYNKKEQQYIESFAKSGEYLSEAYKILIKDKKMLDILYFYHLTKYSDPSAFTVFVNSSLENIVSQYKKYLEKASIKTNWNISDEVFEFLFGFLDTEENIHEFVKMLNGKYKALYEYLHKSKAYQNPIGKIKFLHDAIFKYSVSTPAKIKSSIEYFKAIGDTKKLSELIFVKIQKIDKCKDYSKVLEYIGDYVFALDGDLISREYIETMILKQRHNAI